MLGPEQQDAWRAYIIAAKSEKDSKQQKDGRQEERAEWWTQPQAVRSPLS